MKDYYRWRKKRPDYWDDEGLKESLREVGILVPATPDTEAIVDILLAMLDEYDYRGRNLDFGEYAGRIVAATWKDSE